MDRNIDELTTRDYIRILYRVANSIYSLRFKNHRFSQEVTINSVALSTLNVIQMNEGDNSLEISKKMGVSRSAVSQMLAKLESNGLIEKKKKDGNKKEVYPYLTEAGKKCVQDYRAVHDEFYEGFNEILKDYNEEEKKAVYDFLSRSKAFLRDFQSEYMAEGEKYEWE